MYTDMSKTRTFRLTWIVLSIASAFMLGLFFQPGSSGKRRLPPQLSMQQMQQGRMPQRGVRAPQRPMQPASQFKLNR
jgi:hypothetical protein